MHSILHAFTHSVVWASVVASVFFAAVVTLLIEYLAKPGLEVRKDRILEYNREQRIAIKKVKHASYLAKNLYAAHLTGRLKDTGNSEWTKKTHEDANKWAEEIGELIESASEDTGEPIVLYDDWSKAKVTLRVLSWTFSIKKNLLDTEWDEFVIAAIVLEAFSELATTSYLRLWRIYKLSRKIKSPSVELQKATEERNKSLPD